MKNTIISIGIIMITIISILIVSAVYNQNTRKNEVQDSLSTAVEQSLENIKFNKNYSINNTDEFVADFVQSLTLELESDSDITVNVLNVDTNKGLFDVEVKETFIYPNKKKGTVSCRKTIVLDEYKKEEDKYFYVTFLQPKEYKSDNYNEFKTYSICEGSLVIPPPDNPKLEGHTFKGWSTTKPSSDNNYSPTIVKIDKNNKLVANKSITFYAVFD